MNSFVRTVGIFLHFFNAETMAASGDVNRFVLSTDVTPTRYAIDIATDAAGRLKRVRIAWPRDMFAATLRTTLRLP